VDEEAIYDQKSTSLRPGDFIFFYTDGVIDANEDQENRFGLQRLEGVLFAHRYASAEGIATGIDGALKDFAGAAAPYDDVTILVAKRV
jgi:sigma-B regulation protein RsbU (phosphoserine phosphatase)